MIEEWLRGRFVWRSERDITTVILEFLDNDVRIHEEDLNFTGMVPIPSVGEMVTFLDSGGWRVLSRHFYYWKGGGAPKAKVSFQVEQIGP